MSLLHETPLTINGIDELKAHAGEDLGVSSWHDVTQADVNAFEARRRRGRVCGR
jgi:acyl dehydratase